jgi:hypothetical protein
MIWWGLFLLVGALIHAVYARLLKERSSRSVFPEPFPEHDPALRLAVASAWLALAVAVIVYAALTGQ